jgi:hypothetical protein
MFIWNAKNEMIKMIPNYLISDLKNQLNFN